MFESGYVRKWVSTRYFDKNKNKNKNNKTFIFKTIPQCVTVIQKFKKCIFLDKKNVKIRFLSRLKFKDLRIFSLQSLEIDHQLFRKQCRMYHQALERSKCEYHQNELASCDTKQLFRFVNKLCSSDTPVALPGHSSTKNLANNFAAFIHEKFRRFATNLTTLSYHSTVLKLLKLAAVSFLSFFKFFYGD